MTTLQAEKSILPQSGGWKSEISVGRTPLSLTSPSLPLPASGEPGVVSLSNGSPSPHGLFCVCLCPDLPFLEGHRSLDVGHPYDLILTWLHLQRSYFQIRSQLTSAGVTALTYLFGLPIQPLRKVYVMKSLPVLFPWQLTFLPEAGWPPVPRVPS